jgi:DNA-binding transcriptional LysR family regulator
MQVETLKVFCDVISHHSFSLAAEANGLTQSSASQCVHRLEEHVGRNLIDRSVRPWRVTEEGRRCFDLSRDVLESFDRFETGMHHTSSSILPETRVGSIYSVGFCYMPACAETFSARHPDTPLHIEYLAPDVIVERVADDDLDIGIISFPSARRGLTVHHWRNEEMVVACAPTHPLASQPAIPVPALAPYRFACFDRHLKVGRRIEHFVKEHGVQRRVQLRFDNIEAIKRAVEGGDEVAILPRPTLDREITAGSLVAIPFIEARLVRPLGIVYRKGHRLTPSMQHFIDILSASVAREHHVAAERIAL